MPTAIYTSGVSTVTPGVYSKVDTSALAQVGLGASGIVAVIGTAVGGKPYTAIQQSSDYVRITNPAQGLKAFVSGDLRDACQMLFDPSNDPNIPAGAQQVIAMQANKASSAQAVLSNADGVVGTLVAARYGSQGNKVSVLVGQGSGQGRFVIVSDGTNSESKDNLGGQTAATLSYSGQSKGWVAVQISQDGQGNLVGQGSVTLTGMTPGSGLTQPSAAQTLTVANANGDAGKVLTLWGVNEAGVGVKERLTLLSGQTLTTSNKFAKVLGVSLSAAAAASITITAASTVYIVATGQSGFGVQSGAAFFVAGGKVTFTGIPSGQTVLIDGTDASGANAIELVAGAGATAVTTTTNWSRLNLVILGGAGSGNIAVTGQALNVPAASYPTLGQAAAYVSSLQGSGSGTPPGFAMTVAAAAQTVPLAQVDRAAAKDAAASGGAALTADAYAIAAWINGNSQIVSFTQAATATGAPTASAVPTYLVGGAEQAATVADYQACLNLLKRVRVNTIVALTCDPAIAAAVDAHCTYMCGIGRSERDAFVGVLNASLDGPATLAQVQQQTLALNSKNVRAVPQYVTLYDLNGVAKEYPPHFGALLAAGMQAGSPVGTSLTFKRPKVLAYRNHPSWNPVDDSDALINAGALIMQQVDGRGIRWVRNVTTYQASTNIAFQAGEVNEALNYAVYTLRQDLEFAVGQPGFAGTVNQLITQAKQSLTNLVQANVLTSFDSLSVVLTADRFDIAVQMYPIVGCNFVNIAVYAGNQTITAAA